MSKKHKDSKDALKTEQQIETDNVETDTPEQSASDNNIAKLESALAAAEAKSSENWELYLSARAEADNIRKRAERDISNAHKYALEKFIPELLSVKDSLELGAKAAKESVAETPNSQMQSFIEGSDMAITMFADTMSD